MERLGRMRKGADVYVEVVVGLVNLLNAAQPPACLLTSTNLTVWAFEW
jgi:hypothetical protein